MTLQTLKGRVEIAPLSKPRMTVRDKWLDPPRKCVSAYWRYKDRLKAAIQCDFTPGRVDLSFAIPMPKSWSKKKKADMNCKVHTSRPDRDNLDKGFLDALFKEDSTVHSGYLDKYWAYDAAIEYCIFELDPDEKRK